MEFPQKSGVGVFIIFFSCAALSAACNSTSSSAPGSSTSGISTSGGGATNVTPTGPAPGIPTAPGAPTGTTPTGTTVTLDSEESNFVTLINNDRAQNNLPTLQVSVTLTESSQWMSTDMANNNYLDHTDSLGRAFDVRIFDFGYPSTATAVGENIAAGNATAADTFAQWQSSPPHNANMLDSAYTAIGVGRAYNASSTYGWYWTTDFGSVVDAIE